MALTEPCTLWQRIACCPSPRWQVVLHTYLLHIVPGMRWCIRTIRMTRVLHSSEWLKWCCIHLHDASRWIGLSPAKCHIVPLLYRDISDAALPTYMFSFEMLLLIAIQSSLRIHRWPLHWLRHYCISQIWNILSNLHTPKYYALSPPHSALIHHWLAMLLAPHPHP